MKFDRTSPFTDRQQGLHMWLRG